MATLLDTVIHTDYGQFDLAWGDSIGFDGDADRFFAGQLNGLVGAATGDDLYLVLARRSGGSAVRIDVLEAEPALTDMWEDVVEVSITIPAGAAPRWSSWAGGTTGPIELAAGTYRVRVSAMGRDAGANGEFADGIVDAYLVELWPAMEAPDDILRTTSADAAYWHGEWGGRR